MWGIALLTLALTLWGCGRDQGPASPQSEQVPNFVATPLESGASGSSESGKPTRVGTPIDVRQVIPSATGGTISNGRYTLIVPPNALSQDTEYRVRDDNNGYAECDLYPHGAQFNVPVTLVMDLRNSNANVFTQIFWWDDVHRIWVPMGGVYNPVTRTLTCQLPHFSKYRAGW